MTAGVHKAVGSLGILNLLGRRNLEKFEIAIRVATIQAPHAPLPVKLRKKR